MEIIAKQPPLGFLTQTLGALCGADELVLKGFHCILKDRAHQRCFRVPRGLAGTTVYGFLRKGPFAGTRPMSMARGHGARQTVLASIYLCSVHIVPSLRQKIFLVRFLRPVLNGPSSKRPCDHPPRRSRYSDSRCDSPSHRTIVLLADRAEYRSCRRRHFCRDEAIINLCAAVYAMGPFIPCGKPTPHRREGLSKIEQMEKSRRERVAQPLIYPGVLCQ